MATAKKLQSIVLPEVAFKETPLKEALARLEEKSRELDVQKKGVRFIMADTGKANTPITLSLTNVALMDAVQHVCSISGHSMTIDKNNSVVLKSKKPPGQ